MTAPTPERMFGAVHLSAEKKTQIENKNPYIINKD